MRPTCSIGGCRWRPFLLLVVAGLASTASTAAGATIERIRHYSAPDHTRIVLDLDGPAGFEVREVADPARLAINVRGARFASLQAQAIGDGLVDGVRRNQGATRAQVVLDLAQRAPFKAFRLAAQADIPERIVIDVFRDVGASEAAGKPQEQPVPDEAPPIAPRPEFVPAPVRVIIDPGHGGLDPGAIRGKIREKDIVLAVCQELARLVDDLPGYEAVLTRQRDYYPSLAQRVEIAREEDGDIFLSIHCNTHPRAAIAGMEVYFLSLQGATDREAQELADKENAADLVGLAPGDRQDDAVMSILMDLRMTQVLQQSSRLAENILKSAGGAGLRTRRVKQARFQVLRTLAMPAVLVELAYLSNDADRKLLASREGQRRLAEAVLAGVLAYRRDDDALAVLAPARTASLAAPDGWTRKYRVQSGDTLWLLAKRHGTTIKEIARRNNLRDTAIRVGQRLHLPERGASAP